MRAKFLEFLARRLGDKVDNAKQYGLDDDIELILDDIEIYAGEIIEVAKELIKP
jgi:hypothetical protein